VILVTGATGNVGKAAVDWLRARGVGVRAALRDPSRSPWPDVPTVRFDWRDSGTWDAALEGIDSLILVRPPAIADVEATLNRFTSLAEERGCRKVSFLSVVGVEDKNWVPHRKIERHLRRSAMAWTFLRAGFFAQNLIDSYLPDIRNGEIRVPAGKGKVAWVDARDLGEAAARVLLDGIWEQRTPVLTGPESIGFEETCGTLSRRLGKPVVYSPCTALGYLYHLRVRHRLPPVQCLVQTVLHVGLQKCQAALVRDDLRAILGRSPRTLSDFVDDHLERLR
jgi:uncharacterized protein YbjT (DUF2867 family)